MSSQPKHIVVIRLSAMGDVAMSVPVLRALVAQHPELKITMISRAFLQPLFEGLPNVDFYAADVNGKHKGVKGLYRLSKEIKSLKPDAIADIHDVLRSKLLRSFLAFSGIKIVRIDKGRSEKKALTRAKSKVFKQLKTTHERYADVFRKLGFTLDLDDPFFPEKPKLTVPILELIPQNHLKWIGMAPFAQYTSKMYPLNLIEEVIRQLEETQQYQVLLFGGGAKETEVLGQLASKFKSTLSVAGKLNLKDELKLIANLDAMVSMDSANAHLAAMQGVKTITLWGVTHPYAGFAPFAQPEDHILLPDLKNYPNIPCSIYGNKVCEGYEDVMRTILPEDIVHKIRKVT